jgi:hypothetical protein
MMMFNGDERTARFIRLIEQMQSCEMIDMDYTVSRLTDDDGSIHYNMEIPDKDVLSLIKRPSRIVMPRQQAQRTSNLVEWKTLMERMKNRKPPEGE